MNREFKRKTERAVNRQWSKRTIKEMKHDLRPIAGGSPAATAVAAGGASAPAAGGDVIPFYRASDHFNEPFLTEVVTPGASQNEKVYSIPPGGFLRGIKLNFTATGGVLGSATLAADYPFNLIKSVVVEDISGAPLFGPVEGYLWFLLNKYGGHHFQPDPTLLPSYSGGINPQFTLWIPFEVRSDGLGSLANTDSRAQYRLRITYAAGADATGTTLTGLTLPTLTCVGHVYNWKQVPEKAMDGTPQEQRPPGLATTQFWTREQPGYNAAAITQKHNRVGNLIRTIIFVTRSTAAATTTVQAAPRRDDLTDPIRLRLDQTYLKVDAVNFRIDEMGRKYGLGSFMSTRETGVYVYTWGDGPDGHPSPGDDSDYLETAEATFLQLEVTMANAGNLTILTNDIAPYAELPAEV